MENAGYIGLSYQSALHRQLAVISNNIANASTTGFKAERIMFESVLYKNRGGETYTFVQDNGVLRALTEGRMRYTGNPLDIGLTGKGYLEVETPAGKRWTRNGSLQIDENGQLTTAGGDPVMDDRDRPIRLDRTSGTPEIASDGTITTPAGTAGKLKIVKFEREQEMKKTNENLFTTEEEPKEATSVSVRQGFVEDSNVQPIAEMAAMIDVSRNYQAVQRLIENEHDRDRRAVERISKPV